MPRYKDSPEVRAAKQERREKLRELPSLTEAEDVRDLKSVFKEMVGEVLENGLEAELDDRQAKTAVPRDRKSEFEPRIIRKNETSISRDIIEEKIITMCPALSAIMQIWRASRFPPFTLFIISLFYTILWTLHII